MSHYYAWAIIPGEGEVTDLVAATLAPYDENAEIAERTEDGETWKYNPRGIWDWWQVGGRWTGHLAELVVGQPYDPENDPENADPDGFGRGVKWPTRWAPRPDLDVVPALVVTAVLAEMPDRLLPFAIFTHDSEHVTVKIDWQRDDWKEAQLTVDQVRDAAATILHARVQAGLVDRIVVIDYHS